MARLREAGSHAGLMRMVSQRPQRFAGGNPSNAGARICTVVGEGWTRRRFASFSTAACGMEERLCTSRSALFRSQYHPILARLKASRKLRWEFRWTSRALLRRPVMGFLDELSSRSRPFGAARGLQRLSAGDTLFSYGLASQGELLVRWRDTSTQISGTGGQTLCAQL